MEHLHTSRRLYLGPTPARVQTLLDELWQLRDSEEVGLIKLALRPAALEGEAPAS